MSNETVQFVEMARMSQADKPAGGAAPKPVSVGVDGDIIIHSDGATTVTLHGLSRDVFERLPGRAVDLSNRQGPLWVKYLIESPGGLWVTAFTHEPPAKGE